MPDVSSRFRPAPATRQNFLPTKGMYAVSKAALDAIMRTYAAETASTSSIKVTIVNPGYVRTKMRAQLMPGERSNDLADPG